MKEHPILFSAPMVRAILAGRKTQTRRIVKPQPDFISPDNVPRITTGPGLHPYIRCPYGQPGDRLWVRETFRHTRTTWKGVTPDVHFHCIRYLSDMYEIEHKRPAGCFSGLPKFDGESYWDRRSIPSIHMPRWASRITLEITEVRVERLQKITADDCVEEGIGESWWQESNLKAQYRTLWESINGAGSWATNPWVWVVEIKRADHKKIDTDAVMLEMKKTETEREQPYRVDCCADDCGWTGLSTDCMTFKHSSAPLLCPDCHEVVEPVHDDGCTQSERALG